ncbi:MULTISPECIES: hypothetical protein [unclassified Endozoicomonas]|uniref:hypothetical protein n=2 Tax=Endozoicomonas TaxID=305899 RepID=UPI003BB6C0B4
MDVAQTSATPCPAPQPESNFDTRSVTTSRQWTVCEATGKRLPHHPRECERQKLLRAAESGCLALRRIKLTDEIDYFSGKGVPRPFTLALPGRMMPTRRISRGFSHWMVGIVDPKCLYVYKRDAGTERLKEKHGFSPDSLQVKLLPNLQSVLSRRLEFSDQVIWRVYPRFTSGHLQADGTFSLPKLKPREKIFSLDYPELVLAKYAKEDIKCLCVYKDAEMNISDILLEKRECEKELQLKPLPLVVYCHETGSVEVYFDDELDSKHLARNEHSLNDFAFLRGVASENFRAVLNLLPMSLRAEALSSELNIPPDLVHNLQEAIKLLSNPYCYSYERLLELKRNGLPVEQPFFHIAGIRSLLDFLMHSEIFRHNDVQEQQIRKQQEEEAYRCFQLLLQSGTRLTEFGLELISDMASRNESAMPVGIFNCLVAGYAPFDFLNLQHLCRLPLISCSGSIVEFDRICRGNSQLQNQACLNRASLYVTTRLAPTLEDIQSHLLALFHYKAIPDQDFLNDLKDDMEWLYPKDKKVIGDFSMADYIEWIENLWEQRETYPLYRNWPKRVRQAQEEIRNLKQSLAPDASHNQATVLATERSKALQFVVDAFSKAPVLPENVGDNEATIVKVLQHYYRRPGPERVIKSLTKFMPAVWKPLHSCSHVLRARNNGHWYMELLEKFQQCSLKPDEKELLSLAIIYHDAAAEDVDKSMEESASADYFKRDLTGHYPEQLLKDMALAMTSKENDVMGGDQQNLSESVRWYLRILRFADRMDVIRGCGVGTDFPGLTVARPLGFDARRLDIPSQLTEQFTSDTDNKTEFQRHLEAAMHGAADLAQVTGPLRDQRKKNYSHVYGLIGNGSEISENFEWTTEPVQRMNRYIDDNVRRKIAQEAGIIVCSDGKHRTCKADQNNGITYGIHNSWYDLQQVAIPAEMTLLEKMQYEHDPSLLSPATQQAIEQEVQRLKSEGIRMNTGTLTQKTLHSEGARGVLKQRGIAVISEKRPYLNNDGFRKEWEMLVPKKIVKLDPQQEKNDKIL